MQCSSFTGHIDICACDEEQDAHLRKWLKNSNATVVKMLPTPVLQ